MKSVFRAFFIIFIAVIVAINPANTGIASAVECASSIAPSDAIAKAEVSEAYQTWKSTYVTSSGAGNNLRVQRSIIDNFDTVSEGIAYGMLFAAYNDDKTTFDKLWAYEQTHLNANGLMNWRINADGSTGGYNGASDADEDMAAALIAADSRWGGYKTAAIKQINLVKQHEVETGTFILKPGDVWGGSNLLNPSYLAPAYYDIFASYTNDTTWAQVKAASYRVFNAIQDNTPSKKTGLIPDWSTSTGAAVNNMSYSYGYDGSRAPLRLAMAASWQCDSTASGLLTAFNRTFQTKNLTILSSSYTLEGVANGTDNGTPLLAAAASAATTSNNASYRTSAWNALTNAAPGGYYPDSMRLFGLMVASGVMVNPLELSEGTVVIEPTIPQAPTNSLKGSDSSVTTGTAATLMTSVTVSSPKNNMLVDLELYDSTGKRVAQQIYENQSLTTAPKSYTLSWTPTAEGVYTLKGGIFTGGWGTNVVWTEDAATITASKPTVVTVPLPTLPTPSTGASISIWWPGSTQAVSGVQPFKAVVDGQSLSSYTMAWQVDGGALNSMYSVIDLAPHKESMVNLTNWNWSANNKYTVNFVAKDLFGNVIGQKATVITINR